MCDSTHTVKVPRRALPLRIPVSTKSNVCECVLDVVVDPGVVMQIHFVAIRVAHDTRGVADLRPTSDEKCACTGALRRKFQYKDALIE